MQTLDSGEQLLIADIGGTNARFALCESGSLEHKQPMTLAVKDYPSLQLAIEDYLAKQNLTRSPKYACLAVACPTHEDKIKLTNSHWSFSQQALKKALGFEHLWAINDYTALSHSLPYLNHEQLHPIGDASFQENETLSVIGPGTGLGMGGLIYHQNSWAVLVSEGGHIDFAPSNQLEIEILQFLLKRHKRVSIERLLSGMGIENIYQALAEILSLDAEPISASEIGKKAQEGDELAKQTFDVFFGILASTAGNSALMLQAKGGVFIAGGIMPKLLDMLDEQAFRARFENKGRFSEFMAKVSTQIVIEKQPGLLGTAAFMRHLVTA